MALICMRIEQTETNMPIEVKPKTLPKKFDSQQTLNAYEVRSATSFAANCAFTPDTAIAIVCG